MNWMLHQIQSFSITCTFETIYHVYLDISAGETWYHLNIAIRHLCQMT
uniref:Uncharacterized protein n=1 Tax=Rhizophora mucronata TaxID=61149 RepID=A0A2P2P0Z0_RHIMU